MISLNKILVPIDFSEPSEKAIRYGVELAKKFDSEVHVIHAFESTPFMYGEGNYIPPETAAQIAAAARRQLDTIEVDPENSVKVVRNVLEGHAFVEIVRYAKDNNVDLVVLGTHGRGAIAHMLLGSVAEKVVRKAPCPVLVVRDEEHDFVMP